MTPFVVASVAAACAAALLWPAGHPVSWARSSRSSVVALALVPVVCVVVVGVVGSHLGVSPDSGSLLAAGGRFAGPIGLGCLVAGGGGWLRRRSAARRVRATRGAGVLALCEELAGDLAAGAAPGVALERAARRWPEFAAPAAAHRLGGSVPSAWRALAALPGAADLHVVAGAWQVAERTGAVLAEALAGVATGIREQQRTRRLVASELASARATARLMAALPLLTLAVGSGAGDPVGFLLGTPVGLVCAAAGVALALAGVGWIEAIASGLERDAAWQPGPR